MNQIKLILSAMLLLGFASVAESATSSSALYVGVRESENPGAEVVERWKLYGSSKALMIGVDEYTNGWPRLSMAVRDADESVSLYVPVAEDTPTSRIERYARALEAYRQGDFATAMAGWRELADADSVSATMCAWAEKLLTDAPTDWDGVFDLESK